MEAARKEFLEFRAQTQTELRDAVARNVREEHRACEHLHELEATRTEFLKFRAQNQTDLHDALARNGREEHRACEHLQELEAARAVSQELHVETTRAEQRHERCDTQLRTELRDAWAREMHEEHRACEHLHELEAARAEFLEIHAQNQTDLRDALVRSQHEEHRSSEHLQELEVARAEQKLHAQTQTELRDAVARNLHDEHRLSEMVVELRDCERCSQTLEAQLADLRRRHDELEERTKPNNTWQFFLPEALSHAARELSFDSSRGAGFSSAELAPGSPLHDHLRGLFERSSRGQRLVRVELLRIPQALQSFREP